MSDELSEALGLVETRGLAAMIVAADVMVKDGVSLVGFERAGGGYVTVIVRGDVDSVNAAVAAGAEAAARTGELIDKRVITLPDKSLAELLPMIGRV